MPAIDACEAPEHDAHVKVLLLPRNLPDSQFVQVLDPSVRTGSWPSGQ
jgi:hypothetical protein